MSTDWMALHPVLPTNLKPDSSTTIPISRTSGKEKKFAARDDRCSRDAAPARGTEKRERKQTPKDG